MTFDLLTLEICNENKKAVMRVIECLNHFINSRGCQIFKSQLSKLSKKNFSILDILFIYFFSFLQTSCHIFSTLIKLQ